MSDIMRLLGWTAEGLRCPDHEVNCCSEEGEPYKVSLIQMPNGTGKTTTLTLLRAALSGAASDRKWDSQKIKEFRKRGGRDRGRFEVRLALNGKRVTIIMNFDFELATIRYKTTRGDGQVDGFDPPAAFRRFMSEKFVSFYVFDGELAQHLLDREHTDAETVVEHLFQIDTLNILAHKVGEYWDMKTQKASATDERGLSRRRNRLGSLRHLLQQLGGEKEKLETQRTMINSQLIRQQEGYNSEIEKEENRAKQIAQAQRKVEDLANQVQDDAAKVLERMADPHALSHKFATALYELKMGLDRVKLPESAAREFFEELAQESECVCGRPVDDSIREIIRNRAQHYLGSDDVSLLNSMKTAITDAVDRSREEPEEELRKKLKKLETLVLDEQTARNKLDEVQFDAAESDPNVKKVKEEIDHLNAELVKIDRELTKYDDKDDSQIDERTYGIDIIRHRLANAERKVAEITKTIELKAKRDMLKKILIEAHRKAKEGMTAEICTEANSRISELMPYNNISIDQIDRCLLLKGQSGGSAGEQLSIAYAFLATLFHRSEHKLPFIVDSPAGPIDLAVRPKIGELIPRLGDQFVAFTISSERDGFVPPLAQSCKSPIQYITLFRKGPNNLAESEKTSPSCFETGDGYTIISEKFFNSFQIEAEDA